MRSLIGFLLLFFCVSISYAQNTQERIISFESYILVNANASIDVTEKITIYANQEKFKRGLVRRLPVDKGARYDITNILNQDNASPYHVKFENQYMSIYIGDADTYISPGVYTYTIQYHVDDAVLFLNDIDEIYWNVTGNDWDFVIEKATATITLPNTISISQYAAYTGLRGQQGTNFAVEQLSNHQMYFQTTRALYPQEGFTVAAGWPKGMMQPPSTANRIYSALFRNGGEGLILILSTLLIFAYFFVTWVKYGRDEPVGTIIPLFHPPENLSPAAIRYICNMGADKKTFTTTIVSMAVKGFLKIKQVGNEFTLEKMPDADTTKLAVEETKIAKKLFDEDVITVSQVNQPIFQGAEKGLSASLSAQFENKYFKTNIDIFIPGFLISLLVLGFSLLKADDPMMLFYLLCWLVPWTIASYFLWQQTVSKFRYALGAPGFTSLFTALFYFLFFIPFFVSEIVVLGVMFYQVPFITFTALITIVIMNMVFCNILKQYTPSGRKLVDQILGFRLFLATTERHRLEQFTQLDNTPESFEKLLPYAIALDVENAWSEHFNALLTQAGQDPNQYRSNWYHGPATSYMALSLLLSTSFNSSLSSASSNMSSGSSGGGSSGGGGGGGGGGGW